MAVESFIPLTDAKQTVEKEVKPLPSVAERTTIEQPGKPVPATSLEADSEKNSEKPTRKKRKPKQDKKEPNSIEAPSRNSILIITEKPQAAMKIAGALGTARKYTDGGVSYYEVERGGRTILVGSAVGHLFNLNYVAGQKGWPIFEIEWRPSYEKSSAAFTKKYFFLLKKLARQASEIIVATDFDIEGEVIGWNVLRFICGREDAKRMKYSTLTKVELEKSFDAPLPEIYWKNAYAGEARHMLDWLYGINLSRALMSAIKTTGSFKILSIGRVQGPALKIIVDKEREIMNFKPEPYWQVVALVEGHEFVHPNDIFDKKELDKFNGLKSGIANTKKTNEIIPPTPPFDLTTLQREAYRVFKFSPSQTLALAQRLYLNGFISYPRTSSQKIPGSIQPKSILKTLGGKYPEVREATRARPVEGKKDDPAHPSIYPTGEFGKMNEDEQKLYDLIARRFISVFSKDAVVENTKVSIIADSPDKLEFRASGLRIIERGWTKVYPTVFEENSVPELNGKVNIDEIKILDKETQPPKRYTPTSLITLLEKKNLGTKATRSTIIDILFDRGYLEGKSIQATPLGIQLIETLEKNSPIIIDENLTRQFEEEMEKISSADKKSGGREQLEKKEKEVIEKAKRVISDISKEFRAHEIEIGREILKGIETAREIQREESRLIKCPTCGQGDLRILYSRKFGRSFVACSAYPNCKQTYSLPPNAAIKKAGTDCEFCRFPKLMALRRGKKPWIFCFNLNCEENKKRREAYEIKKKEEAAKKKEADGRL